MTGAGGLLGGRLAELLGERHLVVAGRHQAPAPAGVPEQPLDLLQPASIEAALEAARPDAVVHAAALADADLCEREPARAEALNLRAAEALARACRRRGIRLLALSTDLVLGGERAFSGEAEPPRPLLVYARTKLAGEEATLAEAPGAAVLRVALVHGRGHGARPTASEAIVWSLCAARAVRLFTDQYRTPVDAESVAAALHRLLEGVGAGRFHLGGAERLSRYEMGLRVARVLGLPVGLIEPARQVDVALAAPRPADASLDSGRARRELGWEPRPLDAGIREGRPARG